MLPQWIIEKKRDGYPLSENEIRSFIEGYTKGIIPDYQMSALAMAVYFQGMSFEEITILTDSMMRSGAILDTSSLPPPKADKHSTGGVGDKVSLLLAPIAASCGITVPMISGRGLGITGGTLDKLESIPGYRTNLSTLEFLDVLKKCGCSIIGQTAELAPADKKLYALRDVTGTVPSIPLISASIMSKKLAEGIDCLVLDVKCGTGAFMKTREQARELAKTLVEIGRRMNKKTVAVITDMNQPLGHTAGNAVEIIETIRGLRGDGPEDLMTVTMELSAHMLILAGKSQNRESAIQTVKEQISSGRALSRFMEMIKLHGGSTEIAENPSLLPAAPIKFEYKAPEKGYVTKVDAELAGRACVILGAGRQKTDDTIDHSVGLTNIVKTGTHVKQGEPLLVIHANCKDKLNEAVRLLDNAFSFSTQPPVSTPVILETIS